MKYYLIENGTQVGPFEVSELYNRGIRPDTLVWCEVLENWTPAWKVAELHPVIDSSIVRRDPPKYEPNGPGTGEKAESANASEAQPSSVQEPAATPKARRHSHYPWLLASLIASPAFSLLSSAVLPVLLATTSWPSSAVTIPPYSALHTDV